MFIPLPAATDYSPIPEGVTIFKITKVDANEKTGKIEITMTTKSGRRHIEAFRLKTDGKNFNEQALKALGYFARTALNDWEINTINPEILVGHFIEATVAHDVHQHRDDPTKTVTFIKLNDKKPANCYDDGTTEPKGGTAPTETPKPAEQTAPDEEDDVDLDDLLSDL